MGVRQWRDLIQEKRIEIKREKEIDGDCFMYGGESEDDGSRKI